MADLHITRVVMPRDSAHTTTIMRDMPELPVDEPAIRLAGLSKRFAAGGAVALADVSLEIRSGEIFGIVGRSGAGKSTLIRCLTVLERPTSGTVTIDGAVHLGEHPVLRAAVIPGQAEEGAEILGQRLLHVERQHGLEAVAGRVLVDGVEAVLEEPTQLDCRVWEVP